MSGNGEAKGDPRVGMTLDDKMDSLLEAMVEVREQIEQGNGLSAELVAQNNEILEKLNDLGADSGEGFSIGRYDN